MDDSASSSSQLPPWEQLCDPSRWDILGKLASMPEDQLRAILRPHEDQGLKRALDAKIIAQRSDLDNALDEMTLIEITFQFGLLLPAHRQRLKSCSHFRILCESDAFLRYVSAYQYFGARMLAGRVFPPPWWEDPRPSPREASELNHRTLAIGYPPPLLHLPNARKWLTDLIGLHTNFGPPPHSTPALNFLDGFYRDEEKEAEGLADEPQRFELWLRGLLPGLNQAQEDHFRRLESSLVEWATTRARFYGSVDADLALPATSDALAGHPAIARLALIDVFWFRRLLRADVSTSGRVTYARNTWFKLIRDRALLDGDRQAAERVLRLAQWIRSVFDVVCDLAQNAVELADEQERATFASEQHPPLQDEAKRWRAVFDAELAAIEQQRRYRTYSEPEPGINPSSVDTNKSDSSPHLPGFPPTGWSERLLTGREPRHRVGLALSGGGIRSATFNLGVLQGLQEFDLLRHVDYLSTVSGGGFIGAWLVASVKRTRHWLGKATSWDESIAHLRSYSKYLAPITGILSADTWSMAATWIRNTFLVQLTAVAWLLVLFSAVLLAYKGFIQVMGSYPAPGLGVSVTSVAHASQWLSCNFEFSAISVMVALIGVIITGALAYNFVDHRVETGKNSMNAKWVRRFTVIPSWVGAFLIALMLWCQAVKAEGTGCFDTYGNILRHLACIDPVLLGMEWLLLAVLGGITLVPPDCDERSRKERIVSYIWAGGRAIPIAAISVAVLYLALAGIVDLFAYWAGIKNSVFDPVVFVIGPSLVLAAFALSVLILIGLTGRWTIEAQREWWTRFGAWLMMFGAVSVIVGAAVILGPGIVFHHPQWSGYRKIIPTSSIIAWIGTIVGGLLAGNSKRTSGEKANGKSPSLEKLANLGGLLFLIGMMLVSATALEGFLGYMAEVHVTENTYHSVMISTSWPFLTGMFAVLLGCGLLFSWCFEINIFGLNQFYRNRLARCYLGATRWIPGMRRPHSFTKFDFKDDMPLSDLDNRPGTAGNFFAGPFPIFNCALNLAGSTDLALNTRHSASFSLTPLYCGAERPKVAFAPTNQFAGGIKLGQAVAISGAAASPNMGYNTSPLVAFLLTMFNVRLGWWFPNPGRKWWYSRGLRQSIYYLTRELMGVADEDRLYLNVSDGGHFENLAIYELIRRRCEVIIACDAECDESLQFGSLGNLLRICETDFGATIDLDIKSIREQKDGHSLSHCAIGRIKYDNGSTGYLIYLKASVSGDEEVGISQYRAGHPAFPHESTADQFFTEDQFEGYRKLGLHIARKVFCGTRPGEAPVDVAERLIDMFVPAGCSSEAFLKHSQTLNRVMESFRTSPALQPFFHELFSVTAARGALPDSQEFVMGVELMQLMEDVFLDLRLDEFWEHPDNRGWAILFMRWARSPKFQAIWNQARRTFGIRFEYFCSSRLGLTRDTPIVRV